MAVVCPEIIKIQFEPPTIPMGIKPETIGFKTTFQTVEKVSNFSFPQICLNTQSRHLCVYIYSDVVLYANRLPNL